MEDVTPELLKLIQDEFNESLRKSSIIAELNEKVANGTATYKEANDYAIEVGELLSKAYKHNLSSAVLPDGRMYYNIAQRIINPTMANNYSLVAELSSQVQQILNDVAHIGIKPITPELNQDRIDGIINRLASEKCFDDVAWLLDEPVKTFSQSVVDDSIMANAEFHAKSGMTPKIIRRLAGGCCEWCRAVAGTYTYPDVPKDVYRRHQRCRCTVDYVPETGNVQNVHTKSWQSAEETLAKRREIGLKKELPIVIHKGRDVTAEYMHNRQPGQGKIIYDERYDIQSHTREITVADWLYRNLGGDIRLLPESETDGVKMPDYLWNGKYWELKSTTTEKSANSAIRKAIKQIESNPGGIILDYDREIDLQETVEVVEKRVKGSKRGDIPVDVMIIEKGVLKKIIRY